MSVSFNYWKVDIKKHIIAIVMRVPETPFLIIAIAWALICFGFF